MVFHLTYTMMHGSTKLKQKLCRVTHRNSIFTCKSLIPLRYEKINIAFFIIRTLINWCKFNSCLTKKIHAWINVTFCDKRCNCTRIMLIKTSVTCYGLDGRGFETRRGKEIFCSRSPFQNDPGVSSTTVPAALPRRSSDSHPRPSGAEVKNESPCVCCGVLWGDQCRDPSHAEHCWYTI